MNTAVRVVVADDHPMFRFGLVAALVGVPEVEIVGEAADGEALLALLREEPGAHAVDVVLTDLAMPGMDGVTVTAELARSYPELPVLLLTMHDDECAVRAAVKAGARGYLLKGSDREEIVRAILTVAAGGTVYGARVGELVRGLLSGRPASAEPFPDLTPREREVLALVAAGLGNHAIGHALGLSEKTVRNYVAGILVKLGVPTRAAAVARARDAGIAAPHAGP